MASIPHLVLSCEHATHRVPAEYARLFRGHKKLLNSHRGYDPGALRLAQLLGRRFRVDPITCNFTRLLVEPNRSPTHRRCFSTVTQSLGPDEKQHILTHYYHPHRDRLRCAIRGILDQGHTVLHLGVHSCTPRFNGETRDMDFGLLYNPKRAREADFCRRWREILQALDPHIRVRMNYPYLGISDGLTTIFRRELPADRYLGIEVEVNQGLLDTSKKWPRRVEWLFSASFASAVESGQP